YLREDVVFKKVATVGGSSVVRNIQIKKVRSIIQNDSERKIIVVSAPGKRNDADYKVTDLLLNLGHAYVNDDSYDDAYNKIMARFEDIIHNLNISDAILNDIKQSIYSILTNEMSDDRS